MRDRIEVTVCTCGISSNIIAEEYLGGSWRVFIDGGLLPNGEEQADCTDFDDALREVLEIRAAILYEGLTFILDEG